MREHADSEFPDIRLHNPARLLDESARRPGRAYSFVDCDPIDTSTGYHVYRADAEGHEAVPLVYDGQN